MAIFGIWIYFIFILLIIVVMILKKNPVFIGGLGLIIVGIVEQSNIFTGIQVVFRALLMTATDFLSVILLIGLVSSMTTLLRDIGIDKLIVKPFLMLKKPLYAYWVLGIVLWLLTLFLWPTPAVTLLGVVILPVIKNSGISPLGLASGLCIFGEGLGLSGDFIIRGAPSLLAKAAGIEVQSIIAASVPIVFGSGIVAAIVGFIRLMKLQGSDEKIFETRKEFEYINNGVKDSEKIIESSFISNSAKTLGGNTNKKIKARMFAIITLVVYGLMVIELLRAGIRGDSAAAVIGGTTFFVLLSGAIYLNWKSSFNTFVKYFQEGMRFSMGVFAPIVVIAAFFLLGTSEGNRIILDGNGIGYLEKLAFGLSNIIEITKVSAVIIVLMVAILGAMSGSGFSALPLVGGISVALGNTANISVVSLAVFGQVVAVWTGATVIPWGNAAVVSAITKITAVRIVRQNVYSWLAAVIFACIYTVFSL